MDSFILSIVYFKYHFKSTKINLQKGGMANFVSETNSSIMLEMSLKYLHLKEKSYMCTKSTLVLNYTKHKNLKLEYLYILRYELFTYVVYTGCSLKSFANLLISDHLQLYL